MNNHKYDVAILGAGPGGYVAALRAAQHGLKTVIIEKDHIGGMCLNWGCVPSKSLIASAELYQKIKKAESFGLTGLDFRKVKTNWKQMNNRAQDIVKDLTVRDKMLLDKNGITTIFGEGKVIDHYALTVNDQELLFKNLIIATGSHYPIPDYGHDTNYYTPKTIYSIDELPKTMTIIGAGIIGIEFALLFSSLGVNVGVLERSKKFMPYLDEDMLILMQNTLRKNKVTLHLNTQVEELSSSGLRVVTSEKRKTIRSDVYVSAITRQANLNGLEALLDRGMELRRGYIRTDLRCRTTLPHIYAVGDVNGRFMLAHVASKEGTTAADTISGSGKDLVYDLMPYNLYANPEFASVGLSESRAREEGFVVETGKFPLSVNAKALVENQPDGFIKVVYEKLSGEILGVHIAAYNATDLIGEALMAMQVKSTVWDVAESVHPHPTLSEAYMQAVLKGLNRPMLVL